MSKRHPRGRDLLKTRLAPEVQRKTKRARAGASASPSKGTTKRAAPDVAAEHLRRATKKIRRTDTLVGTETKGSLEARGDRGVAAVSAAAPATRTALVDPTDVLTAHLSQGWKLRPPKGFSGDTWGFMLVAPAGEGTKRGGGGNVKGGDGVGDGDSNVPAMAPDVDADGLQPLRYAYGLIPPPIHTPSQPRHSSPTPSDGAQNSFSSATCARALGQLCGALSAARLTGTVLRHRRWCRAAVAAAERATRHIERLVGSATGPLRRRWAAHAATALVHAAAAKLREAVRILDDDECAAEEQGRYGDSGGDWSDGAGNDSDDDGNPGGGGGGGGGGVGDPFAAAMAAMMGGGGESSSTRGRGGGGATRSKGRGADGRIGAAAVVDLAVALDDVMYELAYHARSCGWLAAPKHAVPDPAAYLTAVTECGLTASSAASASSAVAAAAATALASDNPLLALLHSRLREGARLLSALGLPGPEEVLRAATAGTAGGGDHVSSESTSKSKRRRAAAARTRMGADDVARRASKAERSWIPNQDAAESAQAADTGDPAAAAAIFNPAAASSSSLALPSSSSLRPPPCPPIVQRWRDSTRVWPCHLYAYAAPTPAALRALGNASERWLEVSAKSIQPKTENPKL